MIGRIIAPDFNGTHPWGVQWDSLESLRTVGGGELVDTLALCTLFVCAVPAIILYVLYTP
jgi:hypothetical protein